MEDLRGWVVLGEGVGMRARSASPDGGLLPFKLQLLADQGGGAHELDEVGFVAAQAPVFLLGNHHRGGFAADGDLLRPFGGCEFYYFAEVGLCVL